MKRFYKEVSVENKDGLFVITLDGKPIKTPEKNLLATEYVALADAVVQEWDDQGDNINVKSMPFTGLLNFSIDKGGQGAARRQLEAELIAYINSDLICYYADGPDALLARQRAAWGPLQQIFEEEAGIRLKTTTGITYVEQDPELKKYGEIFLKTLSADEFTVFQALVGVTGSFFIAKAMIKGHINAHEAFAATMVEELHQAEIWGEDQEAVKNRENLKTELAILETYLQLTA